MKCRTIEMKIFQTIRSMIFLLLILICVNNYSVDSKGFDQFGELKDNKLRLCFVEARGTYKKAAKFCPLLEANSNIQCVVGLDRLDCLRRINKGTAHFGVFSSEDLLAAEWAGIEVLITNEMRFNDDFFQYEVVAVVSNDAGINSVNDLRGSRFCHPGHGLKDHWTDILANYFESTLVARGCEDDLSLAESRIKASANFFGPSCKAGPWVADPLQDALLKQRYPSLCEICYNPSTCSKSDKHWGRVGPLYCLTSGDGNVAWVRLDDVKSHFGLSGLVAESDPTQYSYLCPDGHLQPISTKKPCVWVAQPWPAVAAKRQFADNIQTTLESLTHNSANSWQNALLNLLETYHVNITALDITIPINDYLEQAVGFTSAYSFASCNPPRSIAYCTTSLIEHLKCSWLQEASDVYGIEPSLQCIRANSLDECMESTSHRATDIVIVNQNDRVRAERTHHLTPLLYEFSKKMNERYTILAVVRTDSEIYSFNDFNGKTACFPNFEGAAYLSAMQTVKNVDGTSNLNYRELINYFSQDSCTWEPNSQGNCDTKYYGDEGALRCLAENRGQIAFVELNVFEHFIAKSLNRTWAENYEPKTFKLICPYGRSVKPDELCYLHWTSRGYLMINNNTQLTRKNEIYNAMRDMDRLFGKHYESHISPFSLYGPFDRQENILFHDQTEGLRGIVEMKQDRMPRFLEDIYTNYTKYKDFAGIPNSANAIHLNIIFSLFVLLPLINRVFNIELNEVR